MPRPIRDVLQDLQVIEPEVPAGLAEDIWKRIVAAEAASGESTVAPAVPLRRARPRNRVLVVAAVAAAVAVVTGVVVLVPRPSDALALVRDARAQFRSAPPLRLTVERTVSVAQLEEELMDPPTADWVQATAVAYEDDGVWRTEVVGDEHNPSGSEVGVTVVTDGRYSASYDPRTNQFNVDDNPRDVEEPGAALYLVSPDGHGGPVLDEQSIAERCSVEDDTVVAERQVHHIRCAIDEQHLHDLADVYLDTKTGLVLAMSFAHGGGHRVTSIDYGVEHADGSFDVTPPDGSTTVWNGAGDIPEPFQTPTPEGVQSTSLSPRRPGALVQAEDSIWVASHAADDTDLSSGELVQLDPRTGAVRRRVAVPPVRLRDREIGAIRQLTADDDSLYVLTVADRLYTFDAATGELRHDPVVVGEDGNALRVVPAEGQVWIVSAPVSSTEGPGEAVGLLRRIDPTTGEVEDSIELPGDPWAADGAAYHEGTLWLSVLESGTPGAPGAPALLRIDLSLGEIVGRTATRSSGPVLPTANAIWVGHDTVERIDPTNGRVIDTVAIPSPAGQIESGRDGTVWISLAEGHEVTQVDEASGKVLRTQDVGPIPFALTVYEDFIWVSVRGARTVVRFDA